MTGFRPFFSPATGEWIEFTAVAEDSDGQLVRFSWRSVPGGVITEHVQPHQEEPFIITSGEARFTLDGRPSAYALTTSGGTAGSKRLTGHRRPSPSTAPMKPA